MNATSDLDSDIAEGFDAAEWNNIPLSSRLRDYARDWRDRAASAAVVLEAADEIDSLRAAIKWIADDPCTNIEAAAYARAALNRGK